MRVWAGYSSAIHPRPWLRWAVIVFCLPSLVLVPAPGLRFAGTSSGEPRCCTARPGSVCRCPQWRRDAGVCCCSRSAGATLLTSEQGTAVAKTPGASCCSVTSSGDRRDTAVCRLSTTRSQTACCRQTAGPQAKHRSRSAAWQACPCGDEGSGTDASLVAKPRVVPVRLSYCPDSAAVFLIGLPAHRYFTRTDSPEDPPPRIDVTPV